MIRGFYSAGAGLASRQAELDRSAQNLANISTTGYKKQNLSFTQLLYSNIAPGDQNLMVGNGNTAWDSTADFSQGIITATGNETDFAIEDGGFFAVQTESGVRYTRDGSFHISEENDGGYLVNASGGYVLGRKGEKLKAGDGLENDIGVFNFPNQYGLLSTGNNLFEATDESGAAVNSSGTVKKGNLELSNVDMAREMAGLLDIQRSYQMGARFIQTADEIENITNNLRY